MDILGGVRFQSQRKRSVEYLLSRMLRPDFFPEYTGGELQDCYRRMKVSPRQFKPVFEQGILYCCLPLSSFAYPITRHSL